MAKFFTGETGSYGAVIKWEPCNAMTLEVAKRVARRRQVFQGTYAHVGEKMARAIDGNDEIVHRAMHRPASDVRAGWQVFD